MGKKIVIGGLGMIGLCIAFHYSASGSSLSNEVRSRTVIFDVIIYIPNLDM